jgi:hypothetical protein
MSPNDGPNIQFDTVEQAMQAFGIGKPENPDGTIGKMTRRTHQSVKPKGGFKVGQNVRGRSAGSAPKRRVVPKAPPIVEQAPYDEYEEPLPEYLQAEEPVQDLNYSVASEEVPDYQSPAEQSLAEVKIRVLIPASQLKRLLDAIG